MGFSLYKVYGSCKWDSLWDEPFNSSLFLYDKVTRFSSTCFTTPFIGSISATSGWFLVKLKRRVKERSRKKKKRWKNANLVYYNFFYSDFLKIFLLLFIIWPSILIACFLVSFIICFFVLYSSLYTLVSSFLVLIFSLFVFAY